MIEAIHLRNVASYDITGISLTDLKKINFIYGANGSGKTTLTKLIADPTLPPFAQSLVTWKNGLPVKALVYNKEFKEKNFGKGSIDGVFTLGQATKKDVEAINQMTAELDKIKENGTQRKDNRDKLTAQRDNEAESFKEIVWDALYKKYEDDFKEAFKGVMRKEAFRDRLLDEHANNASKVLEYELLKKNSETIFGERPVSLQYISVIDTNEIPEIEPKDIWKKKIIGKADVSVSNLILALNINDWVSEGRAYMTEGTATCPFCQQQTITAAFRVQLEDYFDKTYTMDLTEVKDSVEVYERLTKNLENHLEQIELSEKARNTGKIDLERLSAFIKTVRSQFSANRELLHGKIKEPSRSISLTQTETQLSDILKLIADANAEIKKHNTIVDNYDVARNQLVTAIWKFITVEYQNEISDYKRKQENFQKGIDALNKQYLEQIDKYRDLENKIKDANKNVTGVQPTVDEINRLLKSFGFLNFRIVPSASHENQYQCQRDDGSIAESTLSEGEITFITFLYFLQLAKGGLTAENVTEERVLVIDDPISSLDSNILFVVSSLLKSIINSIREDSSNIRQLILLTHNVYFHKEVSFIDGRTKELNDTFYWILRRNGTISNIQCYETKNPIQNSYGLLWQELRNKDKNSGITVQNIMRRIIENYFKILGKYGDDQLIDAFDNHEEQQICRSLICWINDGSHSIPDDLFIEHHSDVTDKYFTVFENIFTKLGHPEHYKMMMNN